MRIVLHVSAFPHFPCLVFRARVMFLQEPCQVPIRPSPAMFACTRHRYTFSRLVLRDRHKAPQLLCSYCKTPRPWTIFRSYSVQSQHLRPRCVGYDGECQQICFLPTRTHTQFAEFSVDGVSWVKKDG